MRDWDRLEIGIFDINFATGEQYWSLQFRRILRVPDEVRPEFRLILEHVHPDDRRALVAFAMEPLRPHCPRHCTLEHRLVDADGAVRWVHVEAGRAFRAGSDHDVIRVIGLVMEITPPRNPMVLGKNVQATCNRDSAELSVTTNLNLSKQT